MWSGFSRVEVVLSISMQNIKKTNPTLIFSRSLSIIGGARAFSNTASVTSAGKVTQVIGAVVDVQVRSYKKLI